MNKSKLVTYLEQLDRELQQPTMLCVYGSAACILLDEPDRTSLDVDVAAPYSRADFPDLQRAAEKAGLPVNPDEHYPGDHIEWISLLRLCLPKPEPESEILLWQGRKLVIKTVPIPQLIARKLIRYDEIDQSDIQYLCFQSRITFADIESAVKLLPAPFNHDAVVLANLGNVKTDMAMWGAG